MLDLEFENDPKTKITAMRLFSLGLVYVLTSYSQMAGGELIAYSAGHYSHLLHPPGLSRRRFPFRNHQSFSLGTIEPPVGMMCAAAATYRPLFKSLQEHTTPT